MVLRLFVPPGEGQHKIVPRRPEPLAANPTLQNALLSSTALAACYTVLARAHAHRVAPASTLPSAASVFIRSAGRLGTWAALAGFALNVYYHDRFTSVLALRDLSPDAYAPARLWERTDRYTVDDACLAGAALGPLAAALLLRRSGMSYLRRAAGMSVVGAAAGIQGAHAWFQYTGERQTAIRELKDQLALRSLVFHSVFWNKALMARFDPLVQQYVRHNGVFYNYLLPARFYSNPEEYVKARAGIKQESLAVPKKYKKLADAPDPVAEMKSMSCEKVEAEIQHKRYEMRALMANIEFLTHKRAVKVHELAHSEDMTEYERTRRIQELEVITQAINGLALNAYLRDASITLSREKVRQKKLLDAGDSDLAHWMSQGPFQFYRPDEHHPRVAIDILEFLKPRNVRDIQNIRNGLRRKLPDADVAFLQKELEAALLFKGGIDSLLDELEEMRVSRDAELEAEKVAREVRAAARVSEVVSAADKKAGKAAEAKVDAQPKSEKASEKEAKKETSTPDDTEPGQS
ncbi:hypothetical protein BS50DRAFT_634665 [Corynespora cassiicola Philippines]|uniref:Uncharacterized protein n=1 Tax=Corynespora cassiicola Philippines TaxID=1448308 RepID=A0A2T2NPH0_CORCC|nr:hypothetical protein BS50DRAFT_634665 [Corynespora cassiicola Philippines]